MPYKRESYVRYRSFMEACEGLSDAEYRAVNNALDRFALDGVEPTDLTGVAKALYVAFRPQIAANFQRFVNGCKGGCPKGVKKPSMIGNQNARKTTNVENKTKPKQNQTKPNVNDNDNYNENYNDNVNDKIRLKVNVNVSNDLKKECEKKRNATRKTDENFADAVASHTLTPSEEFLEFQEWLEENCPTVVAMERPFTEKQFKEIEKSCAKKERENILLAMENWKSLNQKNKSAYMTFLRWRKLEKPLPTQSNTENHEYDQFSKDGRTSEESGGEPTFAPVPGARISGGRNCQES